MERDPPFDSPGAVGARPRVGVSACLLAQAVRYDGRDKRSATVAGPLRELLELVPVCPEAELGMGVPREPVRLEGPLTGLRMVGVTSGVDWTARMLRFARRRLGEPDLRALDGFILTRGSPSCGVLGVKRFAGRDAIAPAGRDARGLFAARIAASWPALPLEEDERLIDPRRRRRFLERIFAHHRRRRGETTG